MQFGLLAALAVLWLSLSGRGEPLSLFLGACSVALVLFLARRTRRASREAPPAYRLAWLPLAAYVVWLLAEIVKSNLAVTRLLCSRRMSLHPRTLRIRAGQSSELGRMVHANSITLTPGTVSIEVDEDWIDVHSLEGAAPMLEEGEMDRRVCALERPVR